MRVIWLLTLTVAWTVVLGARASAQHELWLIDGQAIGLLTHKQHQEALKLTDEQLKKSIAVTESALKQFHANNAQGRLLEQEKPGEGMKYRQAQNAVLRADYAKEIASFLAPEQLKKLREITIRMFQGEMFHDPDLRNELKLSEEQRTKMDEVFERFQAKRLEISRRLGAKETRQAAQKDGVELNKSLLADLVATLNDEQKKLWEAMQGPPPPVVVPRPRP